MTNNTKDMIEQAAEQAATKAVEKTLKLLKDTDRVKFRFASSFKKTEELLYLYPKLAPDNETRIKIDQALQVIADFDYCDIIASRYFDGMTIQEISEVYDCKHQTITQRKNKMVKILARELFPEDVLKEILEK